MTELLTLPEAARKLHKGGAVSAKTLREAVHKGLLRASRIGRKWMVTESQLDAYLQGTIVPCQDAPAPPISICVNEPDAPQPGSSGTGSESVAQAAAEMAIEKLKSISRRTSPPSTRRPVATISPK